MCMDVENVTAALLTLNAARTFVQYCELIFIPTNYNLTFCLIFLSFTSQSSFYRTTFTLTTFDGDLLDNME